MEQQRISEILSLLSQKYSTDISLTYSNTFELLVAVMLSAQCTDKRVNLVTPKLFDRFNENQRANREQTEIKTAAQMPIQELEQLIRSTGFYHMKAQHIQATAKMILEKYEGKVPDTMEKLTKLPGVARKTANVILSAAFHKTEGITVDTHVKRISQRLRFVDLKGADYLKDVSAEKIENELMKNIPRKYWQALPHLLIKLGRDVCTARRPNCKMCIIKDKCPIGRNV